MSKLPISTFLTERLAEYDPTFELRKGTGFENLFFKPVQFIVQPLRDEANLIQVAQSFRRIVLTDEPDAFSEEAVDALANNLFVYRVIGDRAGGVARVYYYEPVDREWPAGGAVFSGSNGKRYFNPNVYSVTRVQMGAQIENGLYFFDIPIQAEEAGDDYDLDVGGLVALFGDDAVISVTNLAKISGGVPRETNLQLIDRTKRSIAVRDLVTGKGFNAILFENFATSVTELQAVGFGDDEMMRDIVYNTHIGGKVDGYFKTRSIQTGSKDFIGLLLDTTRQTPTTANVAASSAAVSLGNPNVDRTGGKTPKVRQVKTSTAAFFASSVDLSAPINLSGKEYIKIGIDGVIKNRLKVSGVVPSQTSRSEIINAINLEFGQNVIFPYNDSIKVMSPTKGLTSTVYLDAPDGLPVSNALEEVFGLIAPTTVQGTGPLTFVEGSHYIINDSEGKISRVVVPPHIGFPGPTPPPVTSGESTAGSDEFEDNTLLNVFDPLLTYPGDILKIVSGPDAGEYRIIEVVTPQKVRLDTALVSTATGIEYQVSHTAIKEGEMLYVEYWYNPLSIDVGNLVKLDPDGKQRGVRPGRLAQTITDMAFLRVNKIEIIDPVTKTPVGEPLKGIGGFGAGGFGQGPYGIGAGADYYLRVNSPHERFSAFEDSYLVINSGYQGFSFRVTYEYVPEAVTLHDFVRSENERNLDSDMLMKHFLPAYVSGTIEYRADPTDSSIPSNEDLTKQVKDFIDLQKSGTPLEYSDIHQFLTRTLDPFDRYGGYVKKFVLSARIHNTDGSVTTISGADNLVVPKLDPFPKSTTRPLSPRISHWIADDIQLVRV